MCARSLLEERNSYPAGSPANKDQTPLARYLSVSVKAKPKLTQGNIPCEYEVHHVRISGSVLFNRPYLQMG